MQDIPANQPRIPQHDNRSCDSDTAGDRCVHGFGRRNQRELLILSTVFCAPLLALAGVASAEDPLPRPLTHDVAVAFALSHNPELKRVTQQVAEQEGVLLEAAAQRQPSAAAAAAYGYTEKSLFEKFPGFSDFPLPDQNAWQLRISLRQRVYSGGAVEGRVRSAKARLEAARSAVSAAVNQTVFLVEREYFGVLLAREQIGVQKQALQVLEAELAQARVRRQAGTGSEFDVLRAEVAVANARPTLIRAENSYRARQDALRAELGAEVASTEGDQTDLDVQGVLAIPPVTVNLSDAIEAARARRPELMAGASLIAAAHEDRTVAAAGRKPQVSVVGGYELRKASYPASWGETLNGFTIGAQVDYPIFDGHATDARVRQASAREAQAVAARETVRLRIDLEVRDAHRALTEASQLLESADKVVIEATESLRMARTRLAAGTAMQLDVLSAQAALTEARSNLAQAQHDYALGAARLRRAVGTATPID
jgi:outer membrane protein